MRGKYARRRQGISSPKSTPKNEELLIITEKEDFVEEKTTRQEQKQRKEPSWLVSIFASLMIIFLSLSFMTMLDPLLIQAEHKDFLTSLEKATREIMEVPAGRFVIYKNAWGIPTLRIIMINDYSYNPTEGFCVSYKYIFGDAQQKDCFVSTAKRNEDGASVQ